MIDLTDRLAFPNPLIRQNDAVRILAAGDYFARHVSLPLPYASHGRVLFATGSRDGGNLDEIERLSDAHDLDVVLASDSGSTGERRYSLGVKLWWRILYHHDFLLWRAQNGTCCFVPAAAGLDLHFWIGDGRLVAEQGLPFRDVADRARGLRAAATGLARLAGGR